MILKYREEEKCALCPSTFFFAFFFIIAGVCFCLLVTHMD